MVVIGTSHVVRSSYPHEGSGGRRAKYARPEHQQSVLVLEPPGSRAPERPATVEPKAPAPCAAVTASRHDAPTGTLPFDVSCHSFRHSRQRWTTICWRSAGSSSPTRARYARAINSRASAASSVPSCCLIAPIARSTSANCAGVKQTRQANLETLQSLFPPDVLRGDARTVRYSEIFPFDPGFDS